MIDYVIHAISEEESPITLSVLINGDHYTVSTVDFARAVSILKGE